MTSSNCLTIKSRRCFKLCNLARAARLPIPQFDLAQGDNTQAMKWNTAAQLREYAAQRGNRRFLVW
jgi:hypothetical protein